MIRVSSRLAVIFCGLITVFLSRPYRMLRGFDAYARTRMPWTAFSAASILIGALAIVLALVPSAWIFKSREIEKRVDAGWSTPIKLLVAFAGCAYLIVVGMYFFPHSWNFTPALAFSVCPACVLTITVDPSFATVVLFLAPLSAAVYGSLGAILGFLGSILESRTSRSC